MSGAAVMDGAGVFAALYTGPNFGCVNWERYRKPRLRFVVRCRLGYYGPTSGRGYCGNSGDLPIEKAYRYTKREARELAENLGAEVEELPA